MLMAHRLIDALHGRGSDAALYDHTDESGVIAALKNGIAGAEKFDFGVLHLERGEAAGEYICPSLTPDEMQMWSDGLLPLPAPRCWYEFVMGTSRTAFYVEEVAGEWHIARADRVTPGDRTPEGNVPPNAIGLPRPAWIIDGMLMTLCIGSYSGDGLPIEVRATKAMKRVREERPDEFAFTIRAAFLVLYLTMMINSRSTERAKVPAEKQKWTDLRKGAAKAFSHTVVDIIPKKFLGGTGKGGGGAKRLHWRRSHLRRFDHQTAGAKWCAGLAAADGTMGCWAIVIPRFLVGKAELGEVEHEYRVAAQVPA